MRSTRSTTLLASCTALALLAGACAPSDTPPEDDAGSGEMAPATPEGPRIPVRPTGEDELPAAILGEASPPAGEALHYVPGDEVTTGYLAVPEGDGPFPAVILIHEWNGLVDRVRQTADALAAEGYVALAADLYRGQVGTTGEENRALMAEVNANQEAMIANLDAAVAYLRARPDVTGRIGAMGWCFGGGVALSYGLDGAEHEATAIFYGQLLDDPERLAALSHEVYGTFGEMDSGIPPEAVADFEAALREAGIENDLHVYDAVGHGFWLRVDGDPEVRTAPALDAWQRLKSYLRRTIGS